MTVLDDNLRPCLACHASIDDPKLEDKWDQYRLELFHDRITGHWVIECLNCGVHFLLHCNSREGTIKEWNCILRRDAALEPRDASAGEAQPQCALV